VSASLFGVSSQVYIRLLGSGNLAFFSQFTCFHCGRRLWRNGYRQRQHPVSIKLVRLKCSNSFCHANYTAYPSDIFPRYRYFPATVSAMADTCLNSPSGLEQSLCSYQHARENLIEDGQITGPEVSSLRRWIKKLSDPQSILSLFLSARRVLSSTERRLIAVIYLTMPLALRLLAEPLLAQENSSPIAPVTSSLNQVNGDAVVKNDLKFYPQEHPP
jgi:hypothetical protein